MEATKEQRQADEKAVLAAIRKGACKAGRIERVTGFNMRRVDRTLQRLRRAGKIEFDEGAWSVCK